jgi:hypothetical protein
VAYPLVLNSYRVTIANGTSLSPSVSMGPDTLVGLWMPPAWNAAGLTFQVSPDGTSYAELQDGAGNAVDLIVSAGIFISISPVNWRGINMLKLRSGTFAVPVVQGAACTITLFGRPELF